MNTVWHLGAAFAFFALFYYCQATLTDTAAKLASWPLLFGGLTWLFWAVGAAQHDYRQFRPRTGDESEDDGL